MSHMQTIPTAVVSVFEAFPMNQRKVLLETRDLIFEIADLDPRIISVEEALRWGEPAYITAKHKTGSTIRLGIEKASGMPALFFNCKTTLVEEFRQQFGGALTYSKNRAIIIDSKGAQSRDALEICVASALTYHLRNK